MIIPSKIEVAAYADYVSIIALCNYGCINYWTGRLIKHNRNHKVMGLDEFLNGFENKDTRTYYEVWMWKWGDRIKENLK